MFRQTVGLGKIARWRSLRWPSPDCRSSTGSPLARDAVDFALRRHAGQVRDGDEAPFALHPLEVGALLSFARYSDYVVAAGVLHDVLEDTATDENEHTARFGPDVTALVRAVSDDPSIDEKQARKAALRSRVAHGPNEPRAVFAADKVSKARDCGSRSAAHGRSRTQTTD